MGVVSSEDIPCVDFIFNVIKGRVIAIGDYTVAHVLEFLQIVDDLGAKEDIGVSLQIKSQAEIDESMYFFTLNEIVTLE